MGIPKTSRVVSLDDFSSKRLAHHKEVFNSTARSKYSDEDVLRATYALMRERGLKHYSSKITNVNLELDSRRNKNAEFKLICQIFEHAYDFIMNHGDFNNIKAKYVEFVEQLNSYFEDKAPDEQKKIAFRGVKLATFEMMARLNDAMDALGLE